MSTMLKPAKGSVAPAATPRLTPAPVSGDRTSISAPSSIAAMPPLRARRASETSPPARKGQRQQNQQHAREVDGHEVHGKQREHERDAPQDSRREQAGMGELRVQAQQAGDQQDEEDVGLDDAGEESLTRGHRDALDGGVPDRERRACSRPDG